MLAADVKGNALTMPLISRAFRYLVAVKRWAIEIVDRPCRGRVATDLAFTVPTQMTRRRYGIETPPASLVV